MPLPKDEGVLLFVYALCEPDFSSIRYVGLTADLWKRLREHYRRSSSTRVRKWVDGLRKRGLIPSMRVLCEVRGVENGLAAERDEIAKQYKLLGDHLLNDNETGRYRPGATNNKKLTLGGRTMTASQWAQHLGISRQALSLRLQSYPPEIALSQGRSSGYPLNGENPVVRRFIPEVTETFVVNGGSSKTGLTHQERRERRKKIAEMVSGGFAVEAVALHFGVTVATVANSIREFGLKQAS